MNNIFKNIDPYSIKVFAYLKKEYSNFIETIQQKKSEYDEQDFLEFKFTSPIHEDLNLELNTEGAELTVTFDDFHWHFNRFSDSNFEFEIEKAIKFIKEVQDEKIMILRYSKGKAFYKSKLMKKDEIVFLYKNDILRNNLDWWEKITIVSYKGTHDKIITK